MTRPRSLLWMALATTMLVPQKARARSAPGGLLREPPAKKQQRRSTIRVAQNLDAITSPDGRHVVRVMRGAVFVDGRRIHPGTGTVHLLSQPVWRRDGRALAWIERNRGETRLVVLPALDDGTTPMPWDLPVWTDGDRVFWTGAHRVVVGAGPLQPRAIASWSESIRG